MLFICYIITKNNVAMKENSCGRICKVNLSNCCNDVDYTVCCRPLDAAVIVSTESLYLLARQRQKKKKKDARKLGDFKGLFYL